MDERRERNVHTQVMGEIKGFLEARQMSDCAQNKTSTIKPIRPQESMKSTENEIEEGSRENDREEEDQMICGMCNPVTEREDSVLSQGMATGEKNEEENTMEEELLKQLMKQDNDLSEIRTSVIILNRTFRNGIFIHSKTKKPAIDDTKTEEVL